MNKNKFTVISVAIMDGIFPPNLPRSVQHCGVLCLSQLHIGPTWTGYSFHTAGILTFICLTFRHSFVEISLLFRIKTGLFRHYRAMFKDNVCPLSRCEGVQFGNDSLKLRKKKSQWISKFGFDCSWLKITVLTFCAYLKNDSLVHSRTFCVVALH